MLSGTNVPPDFVEYPSQFNEMWARRARRARALRQGLPDRRAHAQSAADKVLAAQTYGEGYASAEYLSAAMLDQSWHQIAASSAPGRRASHGLRGGGA